MSLQSLHLRKAYSSDTDDILRDFYIPALRESVSYDRLAGFFCSTSLAIAARGILGLIGNSGFLRLVVSPRLTRRDLATIMQTQQAEREYIEQKMLEELEILENDFVRDHVFALGWMIANGRLKIRVAIPLDSQGHPLSCEDTEQSALFHQKVGILKDSEGNAVTFSGSVNETASAWLDNIEEFKVFRNWEPFEREYANADVAKFERFWNNQSRRVTVMDIPTAVKRKLMAIAPADIANVDLKKWYGTPRREGVVLFAHQRDTVESWLANGQRGIFEMATGAGKTFAALGCLRRVLRTREKLVTVIACPYQHLVSQWHRDIDKFGTTYASMVVADSSNPAWKNELTDSLLDVSLGYKSNPIVLTTHHTLSSPTFVNLMRRHKDDSALFLVADEVHGLGAEKRGRGLIDEYDMRLGLSATPRRWFDPSGTKAIYDYFGGVVYEFTLRDAINTINPTTGTTFLTPYRYKPTFTSLDVDEIEEYVERTRAIVKRFAAAQENEDRAKHLEVLLYKRADVVKNAKGKYLILEELLDQMLPRLKWTIIYCSPQQIDRVMEIVVERHIPAHRFTMEEKTTLDIRYGGLSERDHLLQTFAAGKHQILVAMRCLDEGVDIPPARTAILMASSGNPREYIQRIGRVLRRYPGKDEATIYDIVVTPSSTRLPPSWRNIEKRIFAKELERYEEIARPAINNAEALSLVDRIRDIMEV